MALKHYRELKTWQLAVDLVEEIYRLTATFPPEEKYGLISQMRRAAVSIPANIAEGYGRSHRREYLHHLSYSEGSLRELETHSIIAGRLGMVEKVEAGKAWALMQEVGKMLRAMSRKLNPNP